MSKQEILITPYGEMMDMLACSLIDAGASQKKPKRSQYDLFFNVK